MSYYGCNLRGMASVLTRSPMQVYNDDGHREDGDIVIVTEATGKPLSA
jgi:hypothetical protein